tara:strand:- start:56 stop:550 length:495 start_codon:yes stop_codon:yes gene_type:complete
MIKKILQSLNILKTKSQKKIEKELNEIDKKKEIERNILIKKADDLAKRHKERKKKCFELWKNTFRKDTEFANELLLIANRVKKNTNLDVYLEYSKDKDETLGYALFIIGKMNVHLSVKDEKTFNISTYSHGDGMNDGVNFKVEELNKCKDFYKKQVLAIYEQET